MTAGSMPYRPGMTMRLSFHVHDTDRLKLLLVGLLFVVVFRGILVTLTNYWASNSTYSYGFLVPLLSSVIVWARKDQLRHVSTAPRVVVGGPVTAGALAESGSRISCDLTRATGITSRTATS